MLRPADQLENAIEMAGVSQPYVDGKFKSARVHGQFLSDLLERRLIRFVAECPARLGVFCVPKKDGVSIVEREDLFMQQLAFESGYFPKGGRMGGILGDLQATCFLSGIPKDL